MLSYFRKPYLASLLGFMLLFISCERYDLEGTESISIVNFDKKYKEVTKMSNLINSAGIKDFKNIEDVKRKLLHINAGHKESNDFNITEGDVDQAYMLLNSLGYLNDTSDYYTIISNVLVKAHEKGVISNVTKDFLINEYSDISSLQNFSLHIENFIDSNNLNTNDLNFLNFLKTKINNSSSLGVSYAKVDCRAVGVAVGIGVSILFGVMTSGVGAVIAGSILSAAEGAIAEEICNQA